MTTATEPSPWQTLVRGVRLSPEFTKGIGVTLALALVATAGRIVVPLTVQQSLDRGILAKGGPDLGVVRTMVMIAMVAVLATALAAYLMNVRLYRSSEGGLASLRVRAFRHVHDLSMLHQQGQTRGSLVSRVTSDVDQISAFMQSGGVLVVVSLGQMLVATVLMAIWSWQLTLFVYACFVPLLLAVKRFQRAVSRAYGAVRERIGEMLGAVAETVVGASVIRAYGAEERSAERIDAAVAAHRKAATKAATLVAVIFSGGEIAAGIANAGVVVLGVLLGIGGHLTSGELIGFVFLVNLFVGPVQLATETLGDAQNAIAGWRRVLGILDVAPDITDPGPSGAVLARGPIEVRFDHVSFAYPGGPQVLHDVDLTIAPYTRLAIVGETGSGKTTFSKLLTRLMDPISGRVLVNGEPLTEVRFESLRERIVMVPQDGFLFAGTLRSNVHYGRARMLDADIELAATELGLADWLDALPDGLDTPIGERGEGISAGERQLVALLRAYVADPDLLVLDEATSAVDPATEVRLQRALQGITRGRTAISIAHRLSTAEAADEVIVFGAGRVVERGPHAELLAAGGVYARMQASWRGSTASM